MLFYRSDRVWLMKDAILDYLKSAAVLRQLNYKLEQGFVIIAYNRQSIMIYLGMEYVSVLGIGLPQAIAGKFLYADPQLCDVLDNSLVMLNDVQQSK